MKSSSRNRYRNRLRLSTLSAIVLVVASLAVAGLAVVISKNRLRALGEEQRKVESEMRLLDAEISALNNKIETLLTRDRVQPRLTGAGTLLRPITPRTLLILRPPAGTAAAAPPGGLSFVQTTP